MERSPCEHTERSASALVHHDDYDGGANLEQPSIGQVSHFQRCFRCTQRTRDLFSDWKSLFWKRRPVRILLWANTVVFAAVVCGEILMFETSDREVRRHETAVFPLCISNAVAFAAACKWEGSVAWANFLGFLVGRFYIPGRHGYDILDEKIFNIVILSFLGMLEVQLAAHLVRIKLCYGLKSVPTIDTIRDAMWYLGIVFVVSLFFETLMEVVNCTTGFVDWSQFPHFGFTSWVSVLAAIHTISPALIHIQDYRPCYTKIVRPSKVLECILLVICTAFVIVLNILSEPLTTVIRPLPYLLYPPLLFSIFRFNRLGWAVVMACISYFCSWGSLHYRSSALYLISGTLERTSPKLFLQIELFMATLGVVVILLAAGVREKKQLTRDLQNMNKRLEDAVKKRTQELMKANSELQVSQTNAEKANHAKSDFLASMSHEIRTPIHGILGLTDLLLQSKLSPEQFESMASVKDCADLLLHIINSILDLAKIEAGRLVIECVPFKIRDVVSTTVRMFKDRAKGRGILLSWKVDANVPSLVAGDPGKLQQCLLNLVGNALKFTHQGYVIISIRVLQSSSEPAAPLTTAHRLKMLDEPLKKLSTLSRLQRWSSWPSSDITVDIDKDTGNVFELEHRTYLEDGHPISMEASDTAMILAGDSVSHNPEVLGTEKCILFEVRDTGIGISEEILQEMFNPFTQADASTSRVYGGTGLGLCIVQRFVELLRGKIWAESEIGKGSTFCFVVPLQPLLGDETLGTNRGLYPSYREVLKPSPEALNAAHARVRKPAAHFSSQGSERRVHSCRSLDSSSFLDKVKDEQGEPSIYRRSADLVETKKRIMEDMVDSGPDTVEKKFISVERQRKLRKGAANPAFSNNFSIWNMTGGPTGEQSDIPFVSESKNRVDVTTKLDAVEVSDTGGKEGKNEGCAGELSSFRNNLHVTSNLDSAGWDVEQGPVETTNPKPEFVELFVDPSDDGSRTAHAVKPHKIESGPKVDCLSKVQSVESFHLLPGKANLHILLAEDNLINQKVASRQLMRHGHTVTIVGDGVQALETLRRDHDKFDLVLMDIQMPNLDGLRATSIFREEEATQGWKRLPILGLTAHAISGYQDTCVAHGMDAYLGKPFQIQDLLQRQRSFHWSPTENGHHVRRLRQRGSSTGILRMKHEMPVLVLIKWRKSGTFIWDEEEKDGWRHSEDRSWDWPLRNSAVQNTVYQMEHQPGSFQAHNGGYSRTGAAAHFKPSLGSYGRGASSLRGARLYGLSRPC